MIEKLPEWGARWRNRRKVKRTLYAVFVLNEREIPKIAEITGKTEEWLRKGLEAAKLTNQIFVFKVEDLKGTGKGHIYKMKDE